MSRHFVVALLVTVGLAIDVHAQTAAERRQSLLLRSMAGDDLFRFYCAPCHGVDGKGKGPVVAALKTPPPDLTTIARRNGGTFPSERLEQAIANEGDQSMPAHGTSDMPVWGPVFRALDPSDTLNKVRIRNVVQYLKSIQAVHEEP